MPTYYATECIPLALPLGELSPQVTERALQPTLNGNINLCAHSRKIPIHIPVGESQNLQPEPLQVCGALCIICDSLSLIVLGAVQFNHQLCRSAIKIHNKFANDPLFVYFHRIFAEKKIPELTFVGCHFPAKPPGIFQLSVVFWYGHCLPSPSSLRSATSPKGRGKGDSHGTPNSV